MEEVMAWIIAGILAFVIGLICGHNTNRRASKGTGSDLDRTRDNLKGAGDDNQRLKEAERTTADRLREQADIIRRAEDENSRSRELVEKAQNLLRSAKHTNSDN